MSDLNKYRTRTKANEGRLLKLRDPITQQETGDWLKIRHVLSDAYRAARTRALQEVSRSMQGLDLTNEEFIKQHRIALSMREIDCTASLVESWSFDNECDPAVVRDWLMDSPQVVDDIDNLGGNGMLFFGSESIFSGNTSGQNADSENLSQQQQESMREFELEAEAASKVLPPSPQGGTQHESQND